jgi:hypothetical protein
MASERQETVTVRRDATGVTYELAPDGWPRIRVRLTDKGQVKFAVNASPVAITAAYLQGSDPEDWRTVHLMRPGGSLGPAEGSEQAGP